MYLKIQRTVFLLACMFVVLITNITGFKWLQTHTPKYSLLATYSNHLDLSTWHKSLCTVILGCILIIAIGSKIFFNFKNSIHKNKALYILSLITLIYLLITSFFSIYPYYSFYGYFDQNKGFFLEASYLIIFIYFGINQYYKLGTTFALFNLFIVLILGLLQFHGYFYIDYEFIKKLLPGSSSVSTFIADFGSGHITASFGNPNYMGSFLALYLPITIFIFFTQKNIFYKYTILILSCITYYALIVSLSRSGLIGSSISIVIFALILYKTIALQWKHSLALFISLLCVTYFTSAYLSKRFLSSRNEIKQTSNFLNKFEVFTENKLFVYKCNGNGVKIEINDKNIHYYYSNGKEITAINKNIVTDIYPSSSQHFTLENTHIGLQKAIKLVDLNEHVTLYINQTENKISMVHPFLFSVYDTKPAKTFFPTYLDNIFSYRIYIWSRTIPFILEKPLFGHGLQSFPLIYPNNDLQGRLNIGFPLYEITDKPHSWYIQILLDLGFVGLFLYISLFFIVALPLYSIIKNKTFKNETIQNKNTLYYLAIMSGIVGYCIANIWNDEWNGVAVNFWFLLGIAYSLKTKTHNSTTKI